MKTAICSAADCHWWTYVTASAARCAGCRRPEGSRCSCKADKQPPDVRSGHKYNEPPEVRAELQAKRYKPVAA